jgi:hypothetical protein
MLYVKFAVKVKNEVNTYGSMSLSNDPINLPY